MDDPHTPSIPRRSSPLLGLVESEVLSEGWTVLRRVTYDLRRLDGETERQTREVYERGPAACVLPFDPQRSTVLLVRQFRLPPYLAGVDAPLLEVCAGVLDADEPEACVRREAEEELGYRLHDLKLAFSAFASPGSVLERVWCFTARYGPQDKVAPGGGCAHEGEDIEVLELGFREAYDLIGTGAIVDAKTIMLLQHLKISLG